MHRSILFPNRSRSWPKSSHFSALWFIGIFLYSTSSCQACSKTPDTKWLHYISDAAEINFVYNETGKHQLHMFKHNWGYGQLKRKMGAQVREHRTLLLNTTFLPNTFFLIQALVLEVTSVGGCCCCLAPLDSWEQGHTSANYEAS